MARYFLNDQPLLRRSPDKQLIVSLERLVRDFPPKSLQPGGGLYYGPTSVAFLFFVLAKHYKDLEVCDRTLAAWSNAYLEVVSGRFEEFRGPRPDRCGTIEDMMSLLALTAASGKNATVARRLCEYITTVRMPNASNEWLYGRAGYLYLLRLVRSSFASDPKTLEMIDDTADYVIEAILASPRPWTWHGKVYVGAVHGIIGIITQIVLTNPSYGPRVEHHLDSLLQNQHESGNWPSTLPDGSDRLVQFCHGAPGVVSSLLSIEHYFPNLKDRIDDAIAAGRAVIKEKGMLTKEPCLCHGTLGNALALESTDFDHLLAYTTPGVIRLLEEQGVMEPSNNPESLWCGEAGRAWTWAVADKGLPKRFIGYNDI